MRALALAAALTPAIVSAPALAFAQAPVPEPPAKPAIFGRADWGARKGSAAAADKAKKRIIVHHTDIPVTKEEKELAGAESWKAAARHARAVQHVHMRVNGWSDIGYHYLIDWEGRVLAGRPVETLGAHTDGHNEGSIGIALMGNFEEQHATGAQLAALRSLLNWLTVQYGVPIESIQGHRHFNATACPGTYVANEKDPDNPLRLIRLSLLAERSLQAPLAGLRGVQDSLMRILPAPFGLSAPFGAPAWPGR